jgi:hypothetical protein
LLAAQIAGYVDAEGCIGIARSFATIHARVDFGNTNPVVVELVQEATGIGSLRERKPTSKRHSASWHWRCQSEGAHGLLEQIYPYLRIKQRQAKLCLYVQERLKDPKSRFGSRVWQKEALNAIKALNRKGPSNVPRTIKLDASVVVV